MLFNLTNLIVISKNSGSILNILTHIRKEKKHTPERSYPFLFICSSILISLANNLFSITLKLS
jgi:hypothetical protein